MLNRLIDCSAEMLYFTLYLFVSSVLFYTANLFEVSDVLYHVFILLISYYGAFIYYILAGIFAVPDYLNKEVVGLLCIMLQVDPLKRSTTAQIRYVLRTLNHEARIKTSQMTVLNI